ncbi:JAB domain-containing protein [Sphingomonas sp. LR60]|uniref:JAB domain-containing protein n=1 Tax=Sphingomonas sp. LR60 TaxID=3050233 RepID=UPI003FA6F88D
MILHTFVLSVRQHRDDCAYAAGKTMLIHPDMTAMMDGVGESRSGPKRGSSTATALRLCDRLKPQRQQQLSDGARRLQRRAGHTGHRVRRLGCIVGCVSERRRKRRALGANHPPGDPSPSRADIDITRAIIAAGKPLDIAVHDHLIVGLNGQPARQGVDLTITAAGRCLR